MPVIILLFMLLSMPIAASAFPDGWRLPTDKELITEPPRDDSPLKYARVESDFNGDGKMDYAYLLKSTQYPGEGLMVRLSTLSGYEWQLLDRVEWSEEFSTAGLKMRINLAQPGGYKTACSFGYWQCGEDEPAVLKLKGSGIYQIRFDGVVAIWFWDMQYQRFKKVWLGNSADY